MTGTWRGGVHLYVCGMCVVYVWLIDAGGVGVVVSPQGGDRWEIASGRSTSGRCQGVAPTVPGEGGRLGRRELARPGMQGRQGIRVSWMWRGGAGAPRVPWRASLEAGQAGHSGQARHSCVVDVTGRGSCGGACQAPRGCPGGHPSGLAAQVSQNRRGILIPRGPRSRAGRLWIRSGWLPPPAACGRGSRRIHV